jgi:hypothetical protein
MPPIVVDFTVGASAEAVVLTTTTIIATIAAIVLATIGLATGRLAAIRGGIALAVVRATVAAVARGGMVGAGLARCTSRILRST